VRDYDLEWESTGLSRSHYLVKVRGGHVQNVEGVKLDGTHIALKPADTSLYSVDGLFTIVADELALLDTDKPFGQPKGTTAVLRFTTDPTFGYLRTYRRDVMGAPSAAGNRCASVYPGCTAGAGERGIVASTTNVLYL